MGMVLLFVFGTLVMVVFTIVWRGRHYGRLAREGVKVTGMVVRKFRSGAGAPGSRRRRIAFTYRGPNGQEYRRSASIAHSKWLEFEEG